jgi:hypothetical protein
MRRGIDGEIETCDRLAFVTTGGRAKRNRVNWPVPNLILICNSRYSYTGQ